MNNLELRHTKRSATAALSIVLGLMVAPVYGQTSAAEADSLFNSGAFRQAASAYRAIISADSSNGTAWMRLGMALRSLEETDQSLEAFEAAATKGAIPKGRVLFEQARVYAKIGDRDEAFARLFDAAEAGYGNMNALESAAELTDAREDMRFDKVRLAFDRVARPCMHRGGYRDFDFWLGSWDVFTAEGQFVGANVIRKEEAGCMVLERWTGAGGSTGTSINFYDPTSKQWTQQWVSASGTLIHISGQLEGKSIILAGEIQYIGGGTFPFRGRWTPLDDGRVRQFFEQSNDGGQTWSPWFEGFYARRGDEEGG